MKKIRFFSIVTKDISFSNRNDIIKPLVSLEETTPVIKIFFDFDSNSVIDNYSYTNFEFFTSSN